MATASSLLWPSSTWQGVVLDALPAALLAILFLQSSLDKVLDRKGNLEWLGGHFAKSPLRGMVPLLLTTITLVELSAGALSLLGLGQILLFQQTQLAWFGAVLSGCALTMLFFGQRLAKDYAGAAGLVPYFLLALGGVYLERF